MNKLTTRTASPSELTEAAVGSLYGLYAHYYGGTSPELFRRDLLEKDHILLLEDENSETRGFTTLKVIPFTHLGRSGRALFSGDTIIDHRFWGEQTLPLAWCCLAGRIKARQPDLHLYWLLIVKGDRTYRYLNDLQQNLLPQPPLSHPARNAKPDRPPRRRPFGRHYLPESGLIRYPESQGHLKNEWLNEKTADNPESRFFRSRNPGHTQGDELVCLTLLEPDNLRSFALRGFTQGLALGAL